MAQAKRRCCLDEVHPMEKGALLAALATCCVNPRCNGCGTCVTPWLDWIHNAPRADIIEHTRLVQIQAARVDAERVKRLRRA